MTYRYSPGYDPRTIDGIKAVTTQSFSELNSKTGRQYEASFYLASLAVSTSTDIIIQIGASNPVLIKDINVQFNSQRIGAQLFVGPSFTGGSAIDVYNLNDDGAVADDITLLAGATVSVTGTAVSPQIVTLGTENLGNRAAYNACRWCWRGESTSGWRNVLLSDH